MDWNGQKTPRAEATIERRLGPASTYIQRQRQTIVNRVSEEKSKQNSKEKSPCEWSLSLCSHLILSVGNGKYD